MVDALVLRNRKQIPRVLAPSRRKNANPIIEISAELPAELEITPPITPPIVLEPIDASEDSDDFEDSEIELKFVEKPIKESMELTLEPETEPEPEQQTVKLIVPPKKGRSDKNIDLALRQAFLAALKALPGAKAWKFDEPGETLERYRVCKGENQGFAVQHENAATVLTALDDSKDSYEMLITAAKVFTASKPGSTLPAFEKYRITFDLYVTDDEQLKDLMTLAAKEGIVIKNYYMNDHKINPHEYLAKASEKMREHSGVRPK